MPLSCDVISLARALSAAEQRVVHELAEYSVLIGVDLSDDAIIEHDLPTNVLESLAARGVCTFNGLARSRFRINPIAVELSAELLKERLPSAVQPAAAVTSAAAERDLWGPAVIVAMLFAAFALLYTVSKI